MRIMWLLCEWPQFAVEPSAFYSALYKFGIACEEQCGRWMVEWSPKSCVCLAAPGGLFVYVCVCVFHTNETFPFWERRQGHRQRWQDNIQKWRWQIIHLYRCVVIATSHLLKVREPSLSIFRMVKDGAVVVVFVDFDVWCGFHCFGATNRKMCATFSQTERWRYRHTHIHALGFHI